MGLRNVLSPDDLDSITCAWVIDGAKKVDIAHLLGVTPPAIAYQLKRLGLQDLQGAGFAAAQALLPPGVAEAWSWEYPRPTAERVTAQRAPASAQSASRPPALTMDDLVAAAALGAALALGLSRS